MMSVQGVLESFLGHALAGGIFCLLGGQPLTVLGCTGNLSVCGFPRIDRTFPTNHF